MENELEFAFNVILLCMLPKNDNQASFNEEEWIRLLFLLKDTEAWLHEMTTSAILQVPLADKRKLFRKTFYITLSGLSHILEKHYYKILRYPGSSKFTIPVSEILSYLRDAFNEPTITVMGTLKTLRLMHTDRIIGFDKKGKSTNVISIITDNGGRIVTAFPGL